MKQVVIIDYGSGNLRSAAKAFELAADGGAAVTVTADPKTLAGASHIVLPGVGAFDDCMRGLAAAAGMREALETQVREKGKPFLGICVGMQMLFDTGHEHGVHEGLGWIAGKVVKIEPGSEALKIPHMGWNNLMLRRPDHHLLVGIKNGNHAYFVHSYQAVCDERYILATTDYGGALAAIVARDNVMGTQFHPEKSQETGLRLICNFLAL